MRGGKVPGQDQTTADLIRDGGRITLENLENI